MCRLCGDTRFCHRVGVLIFYFRYKVVGECKNRDTIAGWPVPLLQTCHCGGKVFAAQKAVAYLELLAFVLLFGKNTLSFFFNY